MRRILAGLALALLIAAPVDARAEATVTIDDSSPSAGDTITFTVESTAQSLVQLRCLQGSELVLAGGGRAHYDSPYIETVWLVSPSYTGGPADCEVTVYTWNQHFRFRTIASLAFEVSS